MSSAVCLQGTALDERLPAALTRIWTLTNVDLLVAAQCSGTGEALPADGTAVWFEPCVESHVRLHVPEGLSTDAAGPACLPVGLQVGQETLRRVQLLSTDAADARRRPAVCLSVFPQEAAAVERIPTDLAGQ